MTRTRLLLVSLVTLLALFAAACSNNNSDGDAGGDTGVDAGSDDSGSDDSGSDDSGSDDSGSDDAGTDDAGSDDAGSDDAGSDDAGSDDSGGDDAGDEPAEERTASAPGVTEDTIKIGVLIADLVGLRDIGFQLPEALTNEYLVSNVGHYFDTWNENGGINGRTVEAVEITWDPLSPATMENACTQATLDQELFMVINASGFSTTFIDCFTVDADMFFMFGETSSLEQIGRAPNRLFTINPPAEVAAVAGTQLSIDDGIIEPGAKVGILSSNAPASSAGADAATAILEAAGHDVFEVRVNTTTDDNAAINAETGAAVSTFDAENVDHLLVLIGFTQASGFWAEVGNVSPDWQRTILDASSANCTPFGASRTDPAAAGAVCVTAYSSYGSPDGGIRADEPFEAECRATYDVDYDAEFAGTSSPGVPAGDTIETVDGETLHSDYPPAPCTMVNVLGQALENAGINPTRDSLAEAMSQVSGPMAFASNGEGAFGEGKNFYSTQMHAVAFTIVPEDTPRGEDGTFNGCPAPTNCWVATSDSWIEIE